MIKYLFIFAILFALTLGSAAAQSETKVGVTVATQSTQEVNLTAFTDAVPGAWLTPPDAASPRYQIEIVPLITTVGTICSYQVFDLFSSRYLDATAIRKKVDLQVTITDLETQNQIASETFTGTIPSGCPSTISCTIAQGHASCPDIQMMPDTAEFASWLTAAMSGLPNLEMPESPDVSRVFTEEAPIQFAVYDPSGQFVMTRSEQWVSIWSITTGSKVHQLEDTQIMDASYSPDGRFLVTSENTPVVIIWDALTGEQLHQLEVDTGTNTGARYSPDGRFILTRSNDNTTVYIWDASTGQELHQLRSPNFVNTASFSPDGQSLVMGTSNGAVLIWDVATGEELHQLTGHTDQVPSVSYSPDGRFILTASLDHTARIWNAATGEALGQLAGSMNGGTKTSYSPDGRFILAIDDDNTACIWDASTGEKLRELAEHTASSAQASFSPDGRFILTIGDNHSTVRISDVSTGTTVRILSNHGYAVWGARYSPDGQFILAYGSYGTAIIWDVSDLLNPA
jgi:uncharacterized protein with WD repeat